jgi:hypothetical protein
MRFAALYCKQAGCMFCQINDCLSGEGEMVSELELLVLSMYWCDPRAQSDQKFA